MGGRDSIEVRSIIIRQLEIPRPRARGSAPQPYGVHPTRYPRDDDDDDDDNDDEDDDDDDACTLLSMYEVLLLHRTRLKRHLLRRM